MPTTAAWAPNQAAVAQVETYTFSAPTSIGNTYNAIINGKTVTYSSVSGDTAALAATGLYNLLNVSGSIAPELTEITFANLSAGVLTATAKVPGTPFANVTINGVAGQGLVLTTGNGLANGVATAHTTPNASPSDVFDAQNWLRITPPAAGVRAIPQNNDLVVIANTSVAMLWNLDRLSAVQLGSPLVRWQSFTGTIGLPENNPNGYTEWRATYLKILGPQGSVPAGGLTMVLGYSSGAGSGPSRERYDLQSSQYTLAAVAAGSPADEYGIRILGQHTLNTFTALGGVSLGIAMLPGETANLSSSTANGGATVGIGPGVTWSAASTLTLYGGSAVVNSAPATLTASGGAAITFPTDGLTWATVTVQQGCTMTWLAGGTVTTLTMATGTTLDKSQDLRALTITNHTIDGDTCVINDPLNTITFTNAGTVRESVQQGPYRFTGSRTVKVT